MMRKVIIALLLAAGTMTGCSNDSRPKDLPPLYPCVITVTQNAAPLDGAVVNLVAVEKTNAKYQASSVTDENGKAVIATYGFDGIPAGRYKVCVWKTVVEGVKEYTNSDGELVESLGTDYRTVEPKYSSAQSTPYEIEITAKSTSPEPFDVGKAVKIKK